MQFENVTVVALFAPGGGVGGLSEMWSEGPPVVTPEGGNAPAADMWYATVAAGQQWLQVITAAHVAAVQEPADAANGVADNNSVPVQDGERAAGVPGSAWWELSEGQNDSQETATVYMDIGGRRGIGKRSVALRVPRGSSAADAVRRWLVEWGVPAALAGGSAQALDTWAYNNHSGVCLLESVFVAFANLAGFSFGVSNVQFVFFSTGSFLDNFSPNDRIFYK